MIVVPDDFPSVFAGSAAEERAKKLGAVRLFTERGADDEKELIRRIDRAQVAINIRAHARFSDSVFTACPALKLVSVWGTGTDNIDLNAAGMRGVTVCNTPGINAFAVAEHALTLMLAVARKITLLDAEIRAGKWPREMLTQLLGKTLGVFGMGTIGARVPALGRGIGMNVLGWSAQGDDKRLRAAGVTPASKEDILKTADVVSLHVRLSTETAQLHRAEGARPHEADGHPGQYGTRGARGARRLARRAEGAPDHGRRPRRVPSGAARPRTTRSPRCPT
jgi:D-3-phosphoglycerate dehydrogenase